MQIQVLYVFELWIETNSQCAILAVMIASQVEARKA